MTSLADRIAMFNKNTNIKNEESKEIKNDSPKDNFQNSLGNKITFISQNSTKNTEDDDNKKGELLNNKLRSSTIGVSKNVKESLKNNSSNNNDDKKEQDNKKNLDCNNFIDNNENNLVANITKKEEESGECKKKNIFKNEKFKMGLANMLMSQNPMFLKRQIETKTEEESTSEENLNLIDRSNSVDLKRSSFSNYIKGVDPNSDILEFFSFKPPSTQKKKVKKPNEFSENK